MNILPERSMTAVCKKITILIKIKLFVNREEADQNLVKFLPLLNLIPFRLKLNNF